MLFLLPQFTYHIQTKNYLIKNTYHLHEFICIRYSQIKTIHTRQPFSYSSHNHILLLYYHHIKPTHILTNNILKATKPTYNVHTQHFYPQYNIHIMHTQFLIHQTKHFTYYLHSPKMYTCTQKTFSLSLSLSLISLCII